MKNPMNCIIEIMKRSATSGLALALALAVVAVPGTSDLMAQTPAPPQSQAIALVGGTLHTASGQVIENGTIVFEDGRITAIGTNVSVPAGARQVDIAGKHVSPGLIDGFSQVGLFEIGGFDVTIDLNELGPFNPNVRVERAVNPESRHIGVARSNGVLVTLSSPSGGLVSGMAAAMMMEGWNWEDMTLKGGAGLIVNWPSPFNESAYNRNIRELRDAFATARAYRTQKQAHDAGDAGRFDTDPRLEAMIPVLEGEIPVIISADEVRQIQDAITWAEEEDLRFIIRGGRDAGYILEHLAERQVPVILTAVLDSPNRAWEAYDNAYSLPARLHEAGVPFAIAGGSSAAYANRLPYEAGSAVGFGLPADEALRSVTLYPAQFLGIDDRVGSLEEGKDATLFISNGHPLDYGSMVEQAYIEGKEIDMGDAHRTFYEKYSEKVRQHSVDH